MRLVDFCSSLVLFVGAAFLVQANLSTNAVAGGKLAAGYNHNLLLKDDGKIISWGNNANGQLGDHSKLNRTMPVNVTNISELIWVEAGDLHSLAVKQDGTVWGWGSRGSGRLGDGITSPDCTNAVQINPANLSGVTRVSAGLAHSLALKADGTVWSWGVNTHGRLGNGNTLQQNNPVQVGTNGYFLTGVVGIAAGEAHNLALKGDGTVWAWGHNTAGKVGDGTVINRTNHVQVGLLGAWLTNIVEVAAGGTHSLGLKADGTVWAWGDNAGGRLGDGTTIDRTSPKQVTNLFNVVSIAAGSGHSLALKQDGTVWGWGLNSYGQLGDGTLIQKTNATQVIGLSNVVAIAAGEEHSVALLQDGSIAAWGHTQLGQLGEGKFDYRSTFQVVGYGYTAMAAGYNHALGLKTNGVTTAWGLNSNGQLGDQTKINRANPVTVIGLSNVINIAGGNTHSFGIAENGSLWGWGDNANGRLGDGTATDRTLPVRVGAATNYLTQVIMTAAGGSHTIALKNDGTVWAWGINSYGRLGDGTATQRLTPVQVGTNGNFLSDIISISAGNAHNFALSSNGTLFGWGNNGSGRIGDGTTINRTNHVQVGVSGFWRNQDGSVSAGDSHSLAIKADGTVWAWGINSNGRLGDGTTTARNTPNLVSNMSNAIAVSAGADHSLALKADGTVWGWGLNTYGQLGDGTPTQRLVPTQVLGLSNVVAIAAGFDHSLALLSNGEIVSWGHTQYGQLGIGETGSSTLPVTVVASIPAVIIPPVSVTTNLGESASFNVSVSGTGLIFQWEKDGVPLTDTGDVSGAQTSTLALSNVSSSDAGDYRLNVSNPAGSVKSAPATLIIIAPLAILTQPSSQTVNTGGTAIFNVEAIGPGITYQWKKNGVNLSNLGNVSGANTGSLTLANVSQADAGGYSVVVSNGSGSLTSTTATLTVLPSLWQFPTGDQIRSSPAIAEDGTIYVGSFDHKLYAVNPNGTAKWNLQLGGIIYGAPAVGQTGDIYVGAMDGKLYSISPGGVENWSYTTGSSINGSPALAEDGTIYFGTSDSGFYALNANGTVKWHALAGHGIFSSPAVAQDGTIYVGITDGSGDWLYALNPNGTTKWFYAAAGALYSSPAIGSDATIYVGAGNNLIAVNPNGTLKWSFVTGDQVNSSPSIAVDGTIYIGSYDNKFYAINPDGTQKWVYVLNEGGIYSSPAIAADGTIYFGSGGARLLALNSDGTLKSSYTAGSYVYSSPAIGENGVVYFGANDGKLHALPGGSPLAESSWPMFRHDNFRTGNCYDPENPVKWVIDVDGRGVSSAPAIGDNGMIYFGADSGKIYAADVNGTVQWIYTMEFDSPIRSSPSIALDGTIYVGSLDSKLYALNPNGTLKWSYNAPRSIYSSPALGADGTIYFGCGMLPPVTDGRFIALNPNGTLKWSALLNHAILSSPAIGANGTIYIGARASSSANCKMFALNPATGAILWSYSTPGSEPSSPALGADGTVYFTHSGNLVALNSDLTFKWSYTGAGNKSPVIGSDGTIYTSSGTAFRAVNPNGTLKWQYSYSTDLNWSPAVASDGTVYAARFNGGTVIAFNADGTVRWERSTATFADRIDTAFTISGDGTVYFGGTMGLCAVTGSAPADNSSWPMFRRDLRHTASLAPPLCESVAILVQPITQVVCPGNDVTFSVSATGTPPLSYQWKFNGVDIEGATVAVYAKSNVESSDAGSYSVVVNNTCSTIASSASTLTVHTPLTIVSQPSDYITCSINGQINDDPEFEVDVSGTGPYSYQWYLNGEIIPDAQNFKYLTDPTTCVDGSIYHVVITGPCGSVESAHARLTVEASPVIVSHPQSQDVCIGQPFTLVVQASGTGTFNYQWRFNGTPISGATASTLTVGNAAKSNADSYDVIVGNTCETVNSLQANITVGGCTQFNLVNVDFGLGATSPKSGPAAIGNSSGDFWNMVGPDDHEDFFVIPAARSAGYAETPIQINVANIWSSGQLGGHADAMFDSYRTSGAGEAIVVTIDNLAAGNYEFYLYGHGQQDTFSTTFELSVNGVALPQKTTSDQPGWETASWTENIQYVRFSDVNVQHGQVVTIRAIATESGQPWLNGMQIVGQNTAPSVNAGVDQQAVMNSPITLNAVVTDDGHPLGTVASTWTSVGPASPVFGNVNDALTTVIFPAVGTYTLRLTATDGDVTSWDEMTVTVISGAPTLTTSCRPNRIVLDWTVPVDGLLNGFSILRATVASGPFVEIANVDFTARQYIDVNDPQSPVVAGQVYHYKVIHHYYMGGVSPDSNVAAASTCQTPEGSPIDVAFIIDNTGSMGGALEKVKDGIAGVINDVATATGDDYRFSLLSPDDDWVNVRLNFAPNNSGHFAAKLAELQAGGGGGSPESTDECLNTVVNALPDDLHGRIDASGCASGGLQLNSFAPSFRANARKYVVLITDAEPGGFCDSPDPARAHAFALDAARIGARINAIQISGTAAVKPVMLDYAQTSCGWFSEIGADGVGIEDAILQMIYSDPMCAGTANIPPIADTKYVAVVKDTPQTVTLTGSDVNNLPLTFTVTDTPSHGTVTGTPPNVTYTPSATYEGPDNFRFKVSNGTLESTEATVSIDVVVASGQAPAITTQPQGQLADVGETIQFSVTAAGTAPMEYQWMFDGLVIEGANGASYVISSAQYANEGSYSVVGSNPFGSVTSSDAVLTLRDPSIVTQPMSQTVGIGQNVTFSVVAVGKSTLSYQWKKSGANISGATLSAFVLNNIQTTDAGTYSVTVSNSSGPRDSSPATLVVQDPFIAIQPISQVAAIGETVTFTVTAYGTGTLHYQWRFDGTSIPGATGATLTKNSVTIADAGTYSVTVNNSIGSATSTDAHLTLNTPPVAERDFIQLYEVADTASFPLDVLLNDANAKSISAFTQPANGTISKNPGEEQLYYSPPVEFSGIATFNYTVVGINGGTDTAVVTLFVSAQGNQIPAVADHTVTLPLSVYTTTVNLLQNASDPNGNVLSVYYVESPKLGTITPSGGSITYQRDPTRFGNDTFSYVVTDGNGGMAIGTVTIGQLDTDGDQMPDDWELAHGLDPETNDSALDPDEDDLVNILEYNMYTDPHLNDNPLNLDMLAVGSAKSGLLRIVLPISNKTQPNLSISAKLNGEPGEATVTRSQSGQWVLEWDTTICENGMYSLQLSACAGLEEFGTVGFGQVRNITLNNPITIDPVSRFYGDRLWIYAKLQVPQAEYSITFYDDSNVEFFHYEDATTDGVINLQLDLTESPALNSKSIRGSFVITPTAPAPNGSSILQSSGPTPDPVDIQWAKEPLLGWGESKFVTAWAYDRPYKDYGKRLAEGVNDILANPASDDEYELLPSPQNGFHMGSSFAMDSDANKTKLVRSLMDWSAGNFFYLGHGTPLWITTGNENGTKEINLHASSIGQALSNHPDKPPVKPLTFVFLHACDTYSKYWSDAFGIDFASSSRQAYLNAFRKARVYVGHDGRIQTSFSPEAHTLALATFFNEWMTDVQVNTSVARLNANAGYFHTFDNQTLLPGANFKISGAVDLYRSYEH